MIQKTLSNWITNAVKVNRAQTFTYSGRRWMPALFDTRSRRRLWKMSRQVGKSTGGAAESVARLSLHDAFNILYVAPEQDQARKYSQDKVKPIIESSSVIKAQIDSKINNVHEKGFKRGGKLYLKYAKHNPDSCRGITADMIHYDEVQDQELEETEPVIDESLFTSNHKLRLYTGTPKSFANPIELKWKDSDQREWVVRCKHHTPAKWINLRLRNIGKHGPTCHHCGNLLDVDDGVWVAHNPGAPIAGFHVNQLHCKISHMEFKDGRWQDSPEEWQEILDKLDNYPEDKFLNEVLGESADSAEQPITEEMLYRCCDPEMPNVEYDKLDPKYMSRNNFAGIDWGHGKYATALVIGQFDQAKNSFRYIYMKTYEGAETDQKRCIPDIVEKLVKFRVENVHCDYGGGFAMNSILEEKLIQKGLGKIVTTNYWSSSAKARDAKWDLSHEIPMLTLNKAKHISDYITRLARKKVVFPRWTDFHPHFSQHFLNVRKELDEKRDTFSYVRVGMDDVFQAAVYCHIIAKAKFSDIF